MTFSVSRDHGAFEWAGNNLFTVFAQPSRLLDPNMWRLVYDVLRFNACARRLAMRWSKEDANLSVGDYLEREGYSNAFRDNYLIVRVHLSARMPQHLLIKSTLVASDCCCVEHTTRQMCSGLSCTDACKLIVSFGICGYWRSTDSVHEQSPSATNNWQTEMAYPQGWEVGQYWALKSRFDILSSFLY